MEFDQIKNLMNDLEEGKLKKIVIKRGDFELHLEKDVPEKVIQEAPAIIHSSSPNSFSIQESSRTLPKENDKLAPSCEVKEGEYVTSPMVGTYYSSPAPDQPLFVKVGDYVTEDMVICIVEAMKVMNEVKAGVSGMVAEILIDNAQPVEFGSKMLRIV